MTRTRSEVKTKITLLEGVVVSAIVLIILMVLATIAGPAMLTRQLGNWNAQAFGANWLVVQYAQDGSVIASWELADRSVGNEESSDGIYFLDNEGNVVHLSGHYVYVEISGDRDSVRRRFLGTGNKKLESGE